MDTFQIAAIGDLNIDIILSRIGSAPEVGKEKIAEELCITLGGSAGIFAANSAVLGSSVCFAGMVGKDMYGNLICRSLEDKNVDTRFVKRVDTPTGVTLCMNYGEDRANLTYPGAMNLMSYNSIDPRVFDEAKHIHLSSVFLQNGLLRDIHKVLDKAAGRGISVSLDPQWDPTEKWQLDFRSVLPKVTIFMPNEKELLAMTGCRTRESAIETVLPYLGGAMVIKCASKGSCLIQKNGERIELSAFQNGEVVDSIGAGDSFNAGFISAFVRGLPLRVCQEIGTLTGAVNTTASGGTGAFTTREEIRQICRLRFGKELLL